MNTLKDKIISHAQTEYSSSPHEFDEEQIKLIIEHDCECDHCGKSVFELDDFPDVSVERKEILCEDCYDNEYRDTCELCEESYEKEDCENGDFPKSPCAIYNPGYETDYNRNVIQSGIYEAIDYPVFTSDYFSCDIKWQNLRLICSMEDWLKIRPHDIDFFSGDELKALFICDSCWENAKGIRDNQLT